MADLDFVLILHVVNSIFFLHAVNSIYCEYIAFVSSALT